MDLLELMKGFFLARSLHIQKLLKQVFLVFFFHVRTTPDVKQCNLLIICSHSVKSFLNTSIFGPDHYILNKESGAKPIRKTTQTI